MNRSREGFVGPRRRLFSRRFELGLLTIVVLLLAAFAVAFFYFSTNFKELATFGYAGVFLINLIGSASIFLPSPAAASVLGGGAFLDSFLGVPAFVWVGLVAGLGETVGEITGYAAGYGGRAIVEERKVYRRIHDWMQRNGFVTMFAMAVVPNPLFDLAGLAAGAVRMPMRNFFVPIFLGKVIKNIYLAALGGLGVAVFADFLL